MVGAVERKTVYFEASGEQNTESVLELVKGYAQAEGIRDIVVASTTGETGVKASGTSMWSWFPTMWDFRSLEYGRWRRKTERRFWRTEPRF
jgi:hypothetical protein